MKGYCPRSSPWISIQLGPWPGIGAAYPGQSLPTCSSLQDKKAVVAVFAFFDIDDQNTILSCSAPPFLYLHEAGVGSDAVRFLDDGAAGGQDIHASAAVRRCTGLTYRVIDRRAFIGMDRPGTNPFGHLGRTDHGTPVIEHLDEIVLLDAP